jgi:hypothetical protein
VPTLHWGKLNIALACLCPQDLEKALVEFFHLRLKAEGAWEELQLDKTVPEDQQPYVFKCFGCDGLLFRPRDTIMAVYLYSECFAFFATLYCHSRTFATGGRLKYRVRWTSEFLRCRRKKEKITVPKELVINGAPALQCIMEEYPQSHGQQHVWTGVSPVTLMSPCQ